MYNTPILPYSQMRAASNVNIETVKYMMVYMYRITI